MDGLYKLSDDHFDYFFSKRQPMILNFNGNLSRKERLIREWLLKDKLMKEITFNDIFMSDIISLKNLFL